MKIGAITIGQSPRDDVTPEFLAAMGCARATAVCATEGAACGLAYGGTAGAACGTDSGEASWTGVELLQRGVLDGLSLQEVEGMSPAAGDGVLVSRLRNGSEAILAEWRVHERMKECIRSLENDGVELIVLFCTGEFSDLTSRLPILRPDRLLANFVAALVPSGTAAESLAEKSAYRICAVIPSPLQSEIMREKWSRRGLEVEITVLSPYSSTREDWIAAAQRVAATGCDVVILDCIGYSKAMKAVFRSVCGKPVILPRTLLGRAVAELAGL